MIPTGGGVFEYEPGFVIRSNIHNQHCIPITVTTVDDIVIFPILIIIVDLVSFQFR